MFIAKYKYFTSPKEGFQLYGYVNKDYIESVFVTMEKKGIFAAKALVVGDTNAQILYFGTKQQCLNYIHLLAHNSDVLPTPEGYEFQGDLFDKALEEFTKKEEGDHD